MDTVGLLDSKVQDRKVVDIGRNPWNASEGKQRHSTAIGISMRQYSTQSLRVDISDLRSPIRDIYNNTIDESFNAKYSGITASL